MGMYGDILMVKKPISHRPIRLSDITDTQLELVEYLLNDLSRHGLRVWQDDSGTWVWEWHGQSAKADELGSAVLQATYWYFGLLPDPNRIA